MILIRKAGERGHFNYGWLDTYHTFSFSEYQDPDWMGFRRLRVINEDRVTAGAGFPTHPHRDMEIITYVLDGEIAHKDSMGNGTTIRPGEVQRMTAGTGVTHSEFNPSDKNSLHLLQIWIFPEKKNLTPGYEQKMFEASKKKNKLCLVASSDGEDGSVTVHQDVKLFSALLDAGKEISRSMEKGRHAWIQVARGNVVLNNRALDASDGAAVSDEAQLKISAKTDAEILVFDLS